MLLCSAARVLVLVVMVMMRDGELGESQADGADESAGSRGVKRSAVQSVAGSGSQGEGEGEGEGACSRRDSSG